MSFADLDASICRLKTYVSEFEHQVCSLVGPADTPQLRENLNQTRCHIFHLLRDIRAKLEQASDTEENTIASERIANAKKDLQEAQKRSQNAQLLANKKIAKTKYTSAIPQALLPSRVPSKIDLLYRMDAGIKNPPYKHAYILPVDFDVEKLVGVALADASDLGTLTSHRHLTRMKGVRKQKMEITGGEIYPWSCLFSVVDEQAVGHDFGANIIISSQAVGFLAQGNKK